MDTRSKRSRIKWRHVLILLSVLAVTTGFATRTFHVVGTIQPTAQDNSSNAKHQQLDTDAFALTEPIPQLSMFVPVVAPHAPPRECTVVSVEFAEHLYNRPPPAHSLL